MNSIPKILVIEGRRERADYLRQLLAQTGQVTVVPDVQGADLMLKAVMQQDEKFKFVAVTSQNDVLEFVERWQEFYRRLAIVSLADEELRHPDLAFILEQKFRLPQAAAS